MERELKTKRLEREVNASIRRRLVSLIETEGGSAVTTGKPGEKANTEASPKRAVII